MKKELFFVIKFLRKRKILHVLERRLYMTETEICFWTNIPPSTVHALLTELVHQKKIHASYEFIYQENPETVKYWSVIE